MTGSFEELAADAESAAVDGWDFSWLDGRATEQRPSWGYQRLLGQRLSAASSALDLHTGGGEVLAGVARFAPLMVATESWPPNLARAAGLLRPRGVAVVATGDTPPLPFAADTFDLVSSRHPVTAWWPEITRVLRPGGSYFAQHIGPASMLELIEYFLGPQPKAREKRHPERERAEARAAGLELVDVRTERLRAEFFDVGAVIYFLRKVLWTVPGFTVDAYRERLRALHERIQRDGVFVAHSSRTLVEARKPDSMP